MNKKEFYNQVKSSLIERVGEDVTVVIDSITKNNGVILDTIIISGKDCRVSPNIYLNDMYEAYREGLSMESVLEKLMEAYESRKFRGDLDLSFFMDYEKMKKGLACKLVHRERNLELLNQVPYIPFYDLAVVFYYLFRQVDIGNASILIQKRHLEMWGIEEKELIRYAMENTPHILPARIRTMEEVMKSLFFEDLKKEFGERQNKEELTAPDEEWYDKAAGQMVRPLIDPSVEPSMFVAGNSEKLFGAAVLLYKNLMEEFAAQVDSSFFILPCSVHELILVPDNGTARAPQLKEMVCEVNATQVEPEDYLSDSVYYFSQDTGELKIIC